MTLSKKDKYGIFLIGAAVFAVVGIFAAKLEADNRSKPDNLGCLAPVTHNTVILIDRTEGIPEQTRKEIKTRIMTHVETVSQPNELVTVFNVTELSRKNLAPTFSYCKPKRDGSRLTEDVKSIEKNYKSKFLTPLEVALNADAGGSSESPIAQSLIDVSLTEYIRGDRNSLLVFSDLLENVPTKFTMYPPQSCLDQQSIIKGFRESKRGALERPTFINTTIYLNIIPRNNEARSTIACRELFWPWFFGDSKGAGAALKINYLPG